jgi:hypothetical protein
MDLGRGRWWSRVIWGLTALCVIAVLALAVILTPSPAGTGTHTQLGMAPCTVLVLTGYPCPSCGLTTCFAHLVRFQVLDAFRANAAGVLIFLVLVVLLPVSVYAMVRNMPVLSTLVFLKGDTVLALICAVMIIDWVVEILTILAS